MNNSASTPTSTSRPADWAHTEPVSEFELLLLGDTAFGQNYQLREMDRGRGNVLFEKGYRHGFQNFEDILTRSHFAVANLETPLTTLRDSPFKDIRPYVHFDDPQPSVSELQTQNIKAVTLANNHTHDMGEGGLLDTLEALEAGQIFAIGAGRNLAQAEKALRLQATYTNGGQFTVSLLSRFRGGRLFRDEIKAYATDNRPGSAPFELSRTRKSVSQMRQAHSDDFVIVLPHWRRDYKWASQPQRNAAKSLVGAGANLVVGHGSHMAQEIDFVNGHLVLHGIGNFVFNSPGRYQKLGVPPYSLLVRLTASTAGLRIRLYPIHTDNRENGYQPRPVTGAEHEDFYKNALERTNAPRMFLEHVEPSEDEYGHCLSIRLTHTGRLEGFKRPYKGTAPSWREDDDGTFAFDRRNDITSEVIESELLRSGFRADRLSPRLIRGERDGMEVLYRVSASSRLAAPAARATSRKDVTRRILQAYNVSVAKGMYFSNVNEVADAVEFFKTLDKAVLKPVAGSQGEAVTVGLTDEASFKKAWYETFSVSKNGVLIEQQFIGSEARFTVVGCECVAVMGRIPPYIVGDGVRTIRELISAKNSERFDTPHLHNRPIILDGYRIERLENHGLSPFSVLEKDRKYVIDQKGGLSTGAENSDITDSVHPSYLEIAAQATRAFVGLDISGVDIIAQDFTLPATPDNHIVVEVNTMPGFGSHHFPIKGEARNVAGALVHHNSREPAFSANEPPQSFSAYAGARDANASLLASEFEARGAQIYWWARAHFNARYRTQEFTVWGSTTNRTGQATRTVLRNLTEQREYLDRAGVRLSGGRIFQRNEYTSARRYFEKEGQTILRAGENLRICIDEADREAFQSAWNSIRHRRRSGLLLQPMHRFDVLFLVSHGHVLSVAAQSIRKSDLFAVEKVHQDYLDAASRAALSLPGLDLCEVVIGVDDISHLARPAEVRISLVRSAPNLVRHVELGGKGSSNLARILIDHLVEPPSPDRAMRSLGVWSGADHESTTSEDKKSATFLQRVRRKARRIGQATIARAGKRR